VNPVRILFLGEAAGAVAAAKETDAAIKGVGETSARTDTHVSGLQGKFAGLGKTALLTGGAFLAAGGIVGGLKAALNATSADQVATAKLEQSFKSAGVSMRPYRSQIEETVKSSAALGFKSGDVKDALGSLVVATGNGRKALTLLSTAQDVARFKHIGLSDAAKILTSAMAGSTRAARQLGLQVATVHDASLRASQAYAKEKAALDAEFPSTTKMTAAQKAQKAALEDALQKKFANIKADAALQDKQATSGKVIDLVNQKLHGQADAYAKTAAGARDKLGAELELLEVKIGGPLLNVLGLLANALANVLGWMQRNGAILKPLAVLIGVTAAAWGIFVGVTEGIPALLALVSTGIEALSVTMYGLPIVWIVAALAAVVIGLVELWQHSQTFRDIVIGTWNAVRSAAEAVFGAIARVVVSAWDHIRDATTAVINFLKEHWRAALVVLLSLMLGPLGTIVALIITHWGQVKSITVSVWNAVKSAVSTVVNGIQSIVSRVFGALAGIVRSAASAVRSGVSALVSGFHPVISILQEIINLAEKAFGWLGKIGHAAGGALHAITGHIPHIPGLAGGTTNFPGGLALVGEHGPELLTLPRGANVFDTDMTRRILSGGSPRAIGGDGGVTYNIQVDLTSLASTPRGVAQELARIVKGAPDTPAVTVVAR
jgi:phage-related protein